MLRPLHSRLSQDPQPSGSNGGSYAFGVSNVAPINRSSAAYGLEPPARPQQVQAAGAAAAAAPGSAAAGRSVPVAPSAQKVGVLLLNLGGPETLDDVQPFLYNLFADPEILRCVSRAVGSSGAASALPPIVVSGTTCPPTYIATCAACPATYSGALCSTLSAAAAAAAVPRQCGSE